MIKGCHRNLSPENIIVQNCEFFTYPDGKVEVNPNASIKLTGFGLAVPFDIDEKDGMFQCDSPSSELQGIEYSSPEILNDKTYDGRKADNWALGMMLVHALMGKPLYDSNLFVQKNENAYWSLMNGKSLDYLNKNGKNKYFNKTMLSLLKGLLAPNESKRFDSTQILQHHWFEGYFLRYRKTMKHQLTSTKTMSAKQRISSYYCFK